jgi:hypothetical protein
MTPEIKPDKTTTITFSEVTDELPPGTHSVNVTNALGNHTTGTLTVEQPATASVTGADVVTTPGKNTTIEFNVTNTGEVSSGYILNVSLPSNTTAVAYSNAGGERQRNESKWVWKTIVPGESVSPAVTVQTPSNNSETYRVNASVLTKESVVDTATTTINTGPVSISKAIDANGNSEIDDREILRAIDYWQNGESVPHTNGETISDLEILELTETWRDNRGI